jgi:hypothetical protein
MDSGPPPLTGVTVLIVEDDEATRGASVGNTQPVEP